MHTQFLLVIAILHATARNQLTAASFHSTWDIVADLKDFNLTCPEKNSCMVSRFSDDLYSYGCHCNAICTQLGTCCADSPPIGDRSYYMVDSCPGGDDDSIWESLCQDEWKDEDDVMKLVPVTSLFTRITYKNYFCFRCNEAGDDFLYWDVTLASFDYEFDETIDKSGVSLSYNPLYQTWVAPLGKDGVLVPVDLGISVPEGIRSLTVNCRKYLTSRCSESWNDTEVRQKCEAYMGIVYMKDGPETYWNVHCALCNFEDLDNIDCKTHGYGGGYGGKKPFSFTHLLDVNRSDGDQVGKIQKCENNFLWDPFAKRCRKLTCALPGYVVKNGKCIPP